MRAVEVNFDGLVGPTHNYAGLSLGNVASMRSSQADSNPRAAALQGLAKMELLASLGLEQAVLPPHERPNVEALLGLGFGGDDAAVLARAAREAPGLLAACASASAMWTANAATVSPSVDAADGRVHVTPANLASKLHRAIEPATTARVLRAVLPETGPFVHHPPLAGGDALSDEGAANHTRLAPSHAGPGLHVFVYGRTALAPEDDAPRRFPARQTREASEAIARAHRLDAQRVVMLRQSPDAVDAGVFHNDVIAVGNESVLLHHQDAFGGGGAAIDAVRRCYAALTGTELTCVCLERETVSLSDAVGTYLFNSQLVTLPGGAMALLAPSECQDHPAVAVALARVVEAAANPIREVRYLDLRQSMRNGGGPACLRLRVVLTPAERAAVAPGVRVSAARLEELRSWVCRHYRDRLAPVDLADPALLDESRRALDELSGLLGLGSVYDFQR
jgi:succinylarginine dihydrolase